jgi:hypothetical protein
MIITANVGGMVTTHDDARSLIKHSCPGLKVEFRLIPPELAESRNQATQFAVIKERHGKEPLSFLDVYSIPFKEQTMMNYLAKKCRSAF